jgi:hemerythrin-like domain-containing protein
VARAPSPAKNFKLRLAGKENLFRVPKSTPLSHVLRRIIISVGVIDSKGINHRPAKNFFTLTRYRVQDNVSMLRDKNLIPLSRQHQHALALCVRIDRAVQSGEVDTNAWQEEIQLIVEHEIAIHFAAEEKELFPAAAKYLTLKNLVDELRAEHAVLRDLFERASARALQTHELQSFAEKLAQHIRKEERQLFEGMQKVMTSQELATLGAALDDALKNATQACALPKPIK